MTTRIRYEVWASDTGEASHWKLLRTGVWFTQWAAWEFAKGIHADGAGYRRVCVEAWDDGRNVYLSTVLELGASAP